MSVRILLFLTIYLALLVVISSVIYSRPALNFHIFSIVKGNYTFFLKNLMGDDIHFILPSFYSENQCNNK